MRRWSRRDFLELALAEVLSLPLLAASGCGSDRGASVVRGSFPGDRLWAAETIGRTALRAQGEVSARRFAAATLERIDAARNDVQAVAALAEASRADLRAGRVVDVDGWTLSRTEVELCALAIGLGASAPPLD